MKTYSVIQKPNKDLLFIIRDNGYNLHILQFYSSVSQGYPAIEFKFLDVCLPWFVDNKEIFADMYPSVIQTLETAGFVKSALTETESLIYS